MDLNWREGLILIPLMALVVFFGFYPAPILDATAASTKALVAQFESVVGPPFPIVTPAAAATSAAPAAESK